MSTVEYIYPIACITLCHCLSVPIDYPMFAHIMYNLLLLLIGMSELSNKSASITVSSGKYEEVVQYVSINDCQLL
jgi:hypothetical protein